MHPHHPRLHFDAAGLAALRERARGAHRRYAERLYEWVERHRDWYPAVQRAEREWDEVALEECGAFVTNAALAAAVSGEAAHLDLARRWALAMGGFPAGELRNYGLGGYAAGLARAYDWLYDAWSEVERERLRGHLAGLVGQLYHGSVPQEAPAHWWAGAHLHHDLWIPVGGYGEAALALLGEVEEAAAWAARAREEFTTCFSWLGDDGAWHEGAADWCYALAPLLQFFSAWQSLTGEDPHDLAWLRQTALYRLYHHLPDDTYVYLNDSFCSGRYNTSGSASCHLLLRLASLFRDPHAQWLAERDEAFDLRPGPKGVYQAPYENSSFQAARREYPHPDAHCAAWNLLWYDPSVPAEPPTSLPRSRRFENAGLAILRECWDEEDAVVSFACGPLAGERCAARMRAGEARSASNFSHAHADYGAFTLFARGQYFLVPAGYARRASHFQNVVCVNGADFPADPVRAIRLETVQEGPGFAFAAGDAAAAFGPELEVTAYRRQLVLLDGCLVVFDDLRLATTRFRAWNRFSWSLHSDPATHALSVSGSTAVWQPRGAVAPRLELRVLSPEAFAWERVILVGREGEAALEALRLSRPEWYSDRMQLVAVFTWEDRAAEPVLGRGEDWLGVWWPDAPGRPAVGFVTEARDGTPEWPQGGSREPLWFGGGAVGS